MKGTCPMKCWDIIIMRATQKNRMSKPVTRTLVGNHFRSSLVSSGQPMVEKGHSAEENQVSRTSSSWCSSVLPHLEQQWGASSSTIRLPHF